MDGARLQHYVPRQAARPAQRICATGKRRYDKRLALAERPHVIILNGVGSVGKTSTARALQETLAKPFLHISMDGFAAMLPERMFGHPDGMTFETIQDKGKPSIIMYTGLVMARTIRGMRHAIAAFAAQGNDLVGDDVMMEASEADEYRALLTHADLRFVGLFAPLDVLEARERARGDREPGLARWQFDRVHSGQAYDLEIETTGATPVESAHRIWAAFGLLLR